MTHCGRQRPSMLRTRFPTSLLAVIVVLTLGAGTVFTGGATAQASLSGLDGMVSDPNGTPLEGVTVIAKKQVTGSSWQYHETQTDESGEYAFDNLDLPGAWNLSYQKDGYATHQQILELDLNESTQHNVTLQSLFESTFTGKVIDGESGEAIEGAKIRVQSWAQGEPLQRSTTSDADGAFSITLFPQENQIVITKKGYSNHEDWTHGSYGDAQRDEIRLWPAPAQDAVIEGRVIDAETGEGVQAQVSLRPDWQREEEATTQSSGADAPEPMIMPRHPGGNNYNTTISDEDGRFRMNAHAGYIVLEANREGYLITRSSLQLTDGDEQQTELELQALPEKSVTISGTVKNAKNGAGVAGAQVNVQVPAAGDYEYTQTDADGKWQVNVRPGYTTVHVHHYGGGYGDYEVMEDRAEAVDQEAAHHDGDDPVSSSGSSSAQPVEPMPGVRDEGKFYPAVRSLMTEADSDASLDIELVPEREPTTTIVGYVVDTQTDQGVPDVQVHLQNHETGGWGNAVTDEDGSYRFETHAGYHTLAFYGDGYLPNGVNTVAPGSGTHRVDIEATEGDWVEAGWWRPGDHDGHHDGYYPMAERGYSMEEDSSDSAMSGGSMDRSSMDAPSGGNGGLEGSPGGLGPYSGPLDPEEAPAPGLLVVLMVIAALIGATARRRTD